MRQVIKFAIAATAAASLALVGCATPAATTPPATPGGSVAPTTTPPKSDLKVGLAYDVGGRGDQSFNDSAAAGLDMAKAEFGVEVKEATAVAGESEAARTERLEQLIEGGYTNIVAVGFAYAKSVGEVAKAHPEVKFAIVDDASEASTAPNVMNIVFAEHEGSFLVGAAAALTTKKDHVGFVGGVQTELIQKFQAGFDAGVQAVNPNIKIEHAYLTQPPDFSGFGDPAKGKTAAEGMFQKGADVVYHAAGGSGAGVFTAAKAAKGWAIGVDSDQAKTAAADVRDIILTSMLKRVDVGVYTFVKSLHENTFKAGPTVFDLKVDGVGYSTTGGHVDAIKDKLENYKKQIIDGTIKVPSTVAK